MTIRVLTGINTTGTLHLGNYCGAIRPCIRASHTEGVESFFFMADLHQVPGSLPYRNKPHADCGKLACRGS